VTPPADLFRARAGQRHRPRGDVAAWAVAAAGCLALLARPAFVSASPDPTARLVVLFVLLGLVGALWPLPVAVGAPLPARGAAWAALALGAAAFVVGWLATGGPAGSWARPWFARSFLLNSLAAVAEEAFFRRFLYGLFARPAVAVTASAGAFALVHVTVWGWWVLPLDLAAGLLLSWQRAASGRWWVPAVTHVLANLLAIL
jgi:membrane protease YdiL (CAAX protease family)